MSPRRQPREDDALVLVVDDYADGREACAEYLSFAGFRICEAATGQEALDSAFALRPQAILMDLSLPDIDGWECIRRLRADPRTAGALLIALTAHALEEYARTAREAGADSVITKPCLLPDLVSEIKLGLGKRSVAKSAHGRAQ